MLEKHNKEIRLFFLPPYCPELNPDEYLNHLMRQKFRSGFQPMDKDELARVIRKILRRLQKIKTKMASLLEHHVVDYASESKMKSYNDSELTTGKK
jgi:hypothetical protein